MLEEVNFHLSQKEIWQSAPVAACAVSKTADNTLRARIRLVDTMKKNYSQHKVGCYVDSTNTCRWRRRCSMRVCNCRWVLAFCSPAARILKYMPGNQFFLENDDKPLEIQTIFEQAATLRNMSVEALTMEIGNNCRRVFQRVIE